MGAWPRRFDDRTSPDCRRIAAAIGVVNLFREAFLPSASDSS